MKTQLPIWSILTLYAVYWGLPISRSGGTSVNSCLSGTLPADLGLCAHWLSIAQYTVSYTTEKNNENINDSLMEVQSGGTTINSVLYPVFNITVFSL